MADMCVVPCSSGSRGYSEDAEAPPRFFERLCGRFEVSREQTQVFGEFSRCMRQCSLAFFLVSATNIILTISQVTGLAGWPWPMLAAVSAFQDCACSKSV